MSSEDQKRLALTRNLVEEATTELNIDPDELSDLIRRLREKQQQKDEEEPDAVNDASGSYGRLPPKG